MEEGRRSRPAMHELAKLVVVWAGGKTLRRRVARSVTGR
jgi:hypothetical protein